MAAPSITSLSPTSGTAGTTVTITGTSFGATQGSSTVTFSGTNAGTATTWSDTSIVIAVPHASAGAGNVVVTVGGLASNGSAFTVVGWLSRTNFQPSDKLHADDLNHLHSMTGLGAGT